MHRCVAAILSTPSEERDDDILQKCIDCILADVDLRFQVRSFSDKDDNVLERDGVAA